MRMQMDIFLFLLVAVLTLATAAPQNKNCIIGCKCQGDYLYKATLKVYDCTSSLVLTKKSLANIDENTKKISFKNISIDKIDKDSFKGLVILDEVIFENTNIDYIDPSAFDLPELVRLSFKKVKFAQVPNFNSDHLKELILNDCGLTQVPKLERLPSLVLLNLANNNIKKIDENDFDKIETLEEIDLANNSISKLPSKLFINHEDLISLTLDNNPLESFYLELTSELEFLSLKSCKLTTFDRTSAHNLASLTFLDLSGNQISVLPIDAFSIMKNLIHLDLSKNKLVELDDNIFFENSKLQKICLDENHFEFLPHFQTRDEIFKTYHFSCKNCGLKSIKNSFDNMEALVTVDLSNNQIDDIDWVFTEIHSLKQLDLSNNKIKSIGVNSLGKNMKLENLNLSKNLLTSLDPVVFTNIQALTVLDVRNCNLTKLWANHNANFPSLERLLVGNNNLTVITVDDLEKVTPKLKIIDLENNPLKCTEKLRDLIEYLMRKSIYSIEGVNVLKTHENLMLTSGIDSNFYSQLLWKQLAIDCKMDSILDDNIEVDRSNEESINDEETDEEEDEDDDNDEELDEEYFDDDSLSDSDDETSTPSYKVFYENEIFQIPQNYPNINVEEENDDDKIEDDGILVDASIWNRRNLERASYILSVTSVFILTALAVLTVAVVITLLILKRNKSFNMHNGNLPRLKIPLWHTQPGQKRHSGSVYKPLSEDLSGPRTPIINRYEFKQTPQVHNSIP